MAGKRDNYTAIDLFTYFVLLSAVSIFKMKLRWTGHSEASQERSSEFRFCVSDAEHSYYKTRRIISWI